MSLPMKGKDTVIATLKTDIYSTKRAVDTPKYSLTGV
jgi:hypothetical protein